MSKEATAFHGRNRAKRNKKYYSVGNAKKCIGALYSDCEIFGLSMGQFSLFDLIEYVLEFAGPADITISTWTAAGADTTRAKKFLDSGKIRNIRWLIDRSFATRQPEYCQILIELFGDCIRTSRLHSKFIVIKNEEWAFAIRTSMNLNANPRIESFEISEDREFVDYLERFADHIFNELSEELNFTSNRKQYKNIKGFDDIEEKPVFEDLVSIDDTEMVELLVDG